MNYIKQLQADNKELKEKISSALHEIRAFEIFLNGNKFTGTENGEWKDWISTGDVLRELKEIKNLLPCDRDLEIKSQEIQISISNCNCRGSFHDENCPQRIK